MIPVTVSYSRIARSKLRLLKLPIQKKQQELKPESRNFKVSKTSF